MADELFKSLRTPPPVFSSTQARQLLREHYDIDGNLEPQASERDQNFLVSTPEGSRYVLKFANESEAEAVTDFQNQGLAHVALAAPDLPVPRVVPTRSGEWMFAVESQSGSSHSVRLLSWLDGVPLEDAEGVSSIVGQMGACLATLATALRDFHHPASDYPLLWDIRNAAELAELLTFVDDEELRGLCQARIQHFSEVVRPRLDTLRKQVIHNDMNPGNVLVNRDDVNRLSGVIDFGDMVCSQLVNDVAVASAYLCRIDDDPFTEVLDFLAAYVSVLPLTEDEILLLPDLIVTRHLTTVMIASWRTSLHPENREYLLRSETRARRMLFKVANQPLEDVAHRFLDVCPRGRHEEIAG